MKKFRGLFLGILILAFVTFMAGCSKKQGQAEKENVNGAPRGYHKEFQEIRVPRVVLQRKATRIMKGAVLNEKAVLCFMDVII